MADDIKVVPPVPHKVPVVDDQGLLTPAWSAWFRQVFLRIGEARALSNSDLATLLIDQVQADLTILISKTSGQDVSLATISDSIDGLKKGQIL